jgi:undecaprenyl-diphosphatase
MTIVQAIVLGAIQGATEFLPISSSGHLVLVPWILNWEFQRESAFIFDVLVQWGTILAVMFYFRDDLLSLLTAAIQSLISGRRSNQSRLAWLILLASLPAAAAGLLLKPLVVQTFESPLWVSRFLLVTAGILFLAEQLYRPRRKVSRMIWKDALIIGIAQSLALFPGISRSGTTIAGGLSRAFDRNGAARFSFLLAVPTMIGAGLVTLGDLAALRDPGILIPPLIIGALVAAVVGVLSIHWLLAFLARRKLSVFSFYCLAVGLGGILLNAIR